MRVAAPVVAFALVLVAVVGGVYAVGVQLDESEPNEPLRVDYEVTNVGGDTATANLSLDVDGVGQVDSETRPAIETGDRDGGTLVYRGLASKFDPGETVDFTVGIDNGSDTASGSVVVSSDTPSNTSVDGFAVSIDSTSSPVTEGSNITVTATVQNTASSNDTQTVELDAGPLGNDSQQVSLDAGNETTVSFEVSTAADDADVYDGVVSSNDDNATEPVIVTDPGDGPEPALVTIETGEHVDATSDAGALVERGVGTIQTVLVPLVLVVGGLGVVGFVYAGLGGLRSSHGGGR
jgi:hypothetical protein